VDSRGGFLVHHKIIIEPCRGFAGQRYESSMRCVVLFLFLASGLLGAQSQSQSALGLFQNHADIGAVVREGSAQYDAAHRAYTISGAGESMWFSSDAFQFAWQQVSGDIALTADISFPETSGNPHRKAVLMIRQSLDPDSAYADVALHGDGLASLQYRDAKGSTTHAIQSNISAPHRLRIERRGDFVYIFAAEQSGGPLRPTGASIRLPLQGSFYVGIGVCSHDKAALAKAVFTNVDLSIPAASAVPPVLHSTLEVVTIASTERRVIYTAASHFEAPNWTRDNAYFFFNSEGRILRLPVAGAPTTQPQTIDTGTATRCNNDHGISPDSHWLAISDQSQPDHRSSVYIVPIEGGSARRVTQNSPSYWHGWSPDGKTLAFVGQRNGEFDIYTIPVTGGEETRLTTAKGLDDGPEYSPDGKYIYFNSERTGHMQIWRMHADGSDQEQITFDVYNNWFPHISPDNKWMVFLSYGSDVVGHPPNKDVELRIMSVSGGKPESMSDKKSDNKSDNKITVLARLFGGQGTMNVPSWSPDSSQVAFVSYELLPEEEAEIK
jgi:TolB protein